MSVIKRFFKRNSHNKLFKGLAGFGRALNRLYENRNHDLYSNGEFTVLKKISKLKPAVIIDGGANIGKYTLVCNELMPNTLIYSLEPVKDTFKLLSQNVSTHENIVAVQKGLYKTNTSKEINIFNSNTHSSLVDIQGLSYESTQKQTIELTKGDDFLKEHKIDEVDLLKIDVEGAEFDALLGFDEHISNGKIKMIQFEYGYINITTKKLLIDFYNYFESKGYLLGKIFPKTVEFRKYEFKYEDFLGPNFIAVKKTETDLINLLEKK
ncbi:FkbM family methyltransferase [Marivirga sp.]|uniref:FkbM family methyltransferase n=1 Tax=Marivirga sp. TaxID=2018662 RepID=UPI003DA798BE